MSKTPYEIRLEVLNLAKDIAYENYHNERESALLKWEKQIDEAESKGQSKPELPELPKCPTEVDIMLKAQFLSEYIDSGNKVKSSPEFLRD